MRDFLVTIAMALLAWTFGRFIESIPILFGKRPSDKEEYEDNTV